MIGRPRGFLVWSLLIAPNLAAAHGPIKGVNHFYNGLLHPLLVPSHVLLLVAVGLLLGQQGPKAHRSALLVFLVATTSGLVAAGFSIGDGVEPLILGASLVVGLLVAASPTIGAHGCSLIGALAGAVVGLDSAQEALSGRAKLVALIGSAVGIHLILFYPMAFADYFDKKPWQRTAVRIIGSWVAASAILALALSGAR